MISKKINSYIVFSTVPSRKIARHIAKALIAAQLAACVNVIPHVESIFYWKHKIDHASELLLMIKTQKKCLHKLKAKIKLLHPYDIPEIIGFPISWGNSDYLGWIQKSICRS